MAGIVSFLFIDIEAVIALIPGPRPEMPFSPMVLKLISLIQPSVILAIAILVGTALAARVGLHSPAAEAAANGEPVLPALRPQIVPGVIAGILAAIMLIALWIIAKPLLPPDFAVLAEAFNRVMPAVLRIFYGGFTEELLLRWGVMTFFVWLPYKLLRKGAGQPPPEYFIAAIAVSALLFGIGHLGVAIALAEKLTAAIVITVILGNSLFGVIAGVLFWKKGLEAAIIAHMTTHVVLVSALYITG